MNYHDYLNKIDHLDVSDILKKGLRTRGEILWNRQPPDLDKIVLYWTESVLRSGRIIVYGAGTFAQKLLDVLDEEGCAKQVFAFVDTYVGQRDFSNFSRPVYHVNSLADLEYESLVVMHPFAEDIMENAALLAGCTPEKVIRVFSSSDYREWERAQLKNRLAISLSQFQSSVVNKRDNRSQ